MFEQCNLCFKRIWFNQIEQKFDQLEQDGTIYKDSVTYHYHCNCFITNLLKDYTNVQNDFEEFKKKVRQRNKL